MHGLFLLLDIILRLFFFFSTCNLFLLNLLHANKSQTSHNEREEERNCIVQYSFLYFYIFTHMCVCVCLCVYIYIYSTIWFLLLFHLFCVFCWICCSEGSLSSRSSLTVTSWPLTSPDEQRSWSVFDGVWGTSVSSRTIRCSSSWRRK